MLPVNYILLTPDFFLVFVLIVAEILLLTRKPKLVSPWFISCLLFSVVGYVFLVMSGLSGKFFYSAYQISIMTNLVKAMMSLCLSLIFIYSKEYCKNHNIGHEFYFLSMFSLLGQFLIVGANDFLVFYLGLEMISLPLYAMIATKRNDMTSAEASIKYYILGALSSAILLYGISMIYGATGTWNFEIIGRLIKNYIARDHQIIILMPMLRIGLLLILSSLFFKLGVAPFHMWVPDIYQGSKTVFTAIIAGSPKLAFLIVTMRFFSDYLKVFNVSSIYPLLFLVVVLSLIIGSFVGVVQKNIKRMFAYSAISHQGFIILALFSGLFSERVLVNEIQAYVASFFYSFTYLITTLPFLAILMLLSSSNKEADHIDFFRGLSRTNPWLALLMSLLMFSMAGIPPTIGFFSKVLVIGVAIKAKFYLISIIAIISSVISAYYYIRIIKLMYFDDPVSQLRGSFDFLTIFCLVINFILFLVLGLWPNFLMQMSEWVVIHALNLS